MADLTPGAVAFVIDEKQDTALDASRNFMLEGEGITHSDFDRVRSISYEETPLVNSQDVPVNTAKSSVPQFVPFQPIPRRSPSDRQTQLLQMWEGAVTEIRDDEFDADLHDVTDIGTPQEAATFPLRVVAASDKPLLARGAIFYWTIGYETLAGGQVKQVAEVRFRRLPQWSARGRLAAETAAQAIHDLLASTNTDAG